MGSTGPCTCNVPACHSERSEESAFPLCEQDMIYGGISSL